MKSKSLLTLVAVLFISVVTAYSQAVNDVIDKSITAIGGKEKMKEIKNMKVYINFDNQGMKIPVTLTFMRPGMMHSEVEVQGMKIVTAFDGKQGWTLNPLSGKTDAEPLPEESLKQLKDQADFDGKLLDYDKKGYKAELLGKEDMEGTPVYKVKLTKGEDATTFFIDAENYLVLKERTKTVVNGKVIESDAIYSDYRDTGAGIKYPYSIEQREVDAEEGNKMTIDKVEVNQDVDEAMFKMPKSTVTKTSTTPKDK